MIFSNKYSVGAALNGVAFSGTAFKFKSSSRNTISSQKKIVKKGYYGNESLGLA